MQLGGLVRQERLPPDIHLAVARPMWRQADPASCTGLFASHEERQAVRRLRVSIHV